MKDEETLQTRQERARAIDAYSIKFEQPTRAGQIPVRKAQRLDVDGILARSLPQTFGQSSSVKAETKAGE